MTMPTDAQYAAAAAILLGVLDAPPNVAEQLIRDALDAAERAAWCSDMSRAQRDGTSILISGGTFFDTGTTFPTESPMTGFIAEVRWNDRRDWWQGECSGNYEEYYIYKPVWWRPLPTPPAEEPAR